MNILFSGVFKGYERTELEAIAISNGFNVISSVSGKLTYLVAGEKMGEAKRQKAIELGVSIIDLDAFLQKISQGVTTIINEKSTSEFDGNQSETDFLATLNAISWKEFSVDISGKQLLDALIEHEAKWGITKAHTYASEQLKASLTLMHPFGHDNEIEFYDLSPDGKWLATGNCNECEGVLQVWEVETGRIVNALYIDGGVAFPEEEGIKWSPDSTMIGMTFNTNGVGAWMPFSSDTNPLAYAYVTNGWNRPPGFAWYPDSKSFFIACPIFETFDDSVFNGNDEKRDAYAEDRNNGCKLDLTEVQGDISDTAIKAKRPKIKEENHNAFDKAKKKGINVDRSFKVLEGINGSFVVVGESCIQFHSGAGLSMGEYYFDRPDDESDFEMHKENKIRIDFGIELEDELIWAAALKQGIVIAPEAFDVNKTLNWSLNNHWAWKCSWLPPIHVEKVEDLIKYPQDDLPQWIVEKISTKKPKTAKTKVDKTPAKSSEKTVVDIRNLTLQSFKNISTTYKWNPLDSDQYYTAIAISDIRSNHAEDAKELLPLLTQEQYALYASEIAWQYYMSTQEHILP